MEEMTTNTAAAGTGLPELERKSRTRMEREARELAIYEERKKLIAVKDQNRTNVNVFLMQRYGINNTVTLYRICNRVEKRLKEAKRQRRAQS